MNKPKLNLHTFGVTLTYSHADKMYLLTGIGGPRVWIKTRKRAQVAFDLRVKTVVEMGYQAGELKAL